MLVLEPQMACREMQGSASARTLAGAVVATLHLLPAHFDNCPDCIVSERSAVKELQSVDLVTNFQS